jgi:2',3'-cyclic-nucleotide 2'-phosphodiesterase (5'-nucleotidase family)
VRFLSLLYIGAILFLGCKQYPKFSSFEQNGYYIQDTFAIKSTKIDSIILPYQEKVSQTMNEVLNSTDMLMEKGIPESLLGNLISDLCMNFCPEVDFCILNNGGLRVPLPQGNITRGKIFELMPFENELVAVTLSGSTTFKLFKYIQNKKGVPFSKELRLEIKNENILASINNQPFDSLRNYTILTSDYLARGGDNMTFFKDAIDIKPCNIKLRDAIIEHFISEKNNGNTIKSKLDNRIKYVD